MFWRKPSRRKSFRIRPEFLEGAGKVSRPPGIFWGLPKAATWQGQNVGRVSPRGGQPLLFVGCLVGAPSLGASPLLVGWCWGAAPPMSGMCWEVGPPLGAATSMGNSAKGQRGGPHGGILPLLVETCWCGGGPLGASLQAPTSPSPSINRGEGSHFYTHHLCSHIRHSMICLLSLALNEIVS